MPHLSLSPHFGGGFFIYNSGKSSTSNCFTSNPRIFRSNQWIMKNYILWISALILTSCAEEKHNFVYGEYKEIGYMNGELDDDLYDILPPDIYDGNVFNDTLYLTHSDYSIRCQY